MGPISSPPQVVQVAALYCGKDFCAILALTRSASESLLSPRHVQGFLLKALWRSAIARTASEQSEACHFYLKLEKHFSARQSIQSDRLPLRMPGHSFV